jgi:GT2 family glycosyltransferase
MPNPLKLSKRTFVATSQGEKGEKTAQFVRVTIGVCARNCEVSIRDVINSIMSQDFPHNRIKIVFIDDGSKDRTLSVIQQFIPELDMVAVAFHTAWEGLGHARNMVLKNAEGDYILWVDGDMFMSPDFLSKLVAYIERDPTAAIVKGRLALVPKPNLLATLENYSRAASKMVDYQSPKSRFKAVGTGGSLYLIQALRSVGGFDEKLRGYGEDWDVELRLRKAGWSMYTVDATFVDYERYGLTWKSLWCRYWLRGYFTHYFLHKNRGMIEHYRMFPPAASLSGLLSSFVIYRLTRQKAVFLLALESTFKMTAWYVGFLRSHFDSYAPCL